MRDPGLDFQPQGPRPFAVVLLLAAGVLCADAGLTHLALGEQLAEAESRVAQLERRLERQAASRRQASPEHALTAEENKSLQQAVAAIGLDWERLYRRIDAASGEDVSLLAVAPNLSGKLVQIGGEARDMQAALAFVEALRQPPLSRVVLVSHQVRQNDPQRPIAFEITATWSTGS